MKEIEDLKEDSINIVEYWRIIVSRKKLVFISTAAAFVASVIVSLLLTNEYAAKASVMPPQLDSNLPMVSQLGSIGSLTGGLLGGKSPADAWIGVLKSNNVKDAIIKRFDIRKQFGLDTIEGAREQLDDMVTIDKSEEEVISVTVFHNVPEQAARMANAFIEELDRVNKEVMMTSGKRSRVFLEDRLKKAQASLSEIEEQIKMFQETNKAIKLDDQSKTMIDAMGSMKGQLMAKEIELESLRSYATSENPQVKMAELQVRELKSKLSELENGSSARDIFIPTARIPGLSLTYVRLLRDAKVQQALFETLIQQYEIARLQEAKDSPTVQILDIATVPEEAVKPKRILIIGVATISIFLMSIIAAFLLEFKNKLINGFGILD